MAATGQRRLAFLCFGNDWDGHPSSMLHVFALIAEGHPVVWINSIGQRMPRFTRRDARRLLAKLRGMWRGAPPISPRTRRPRALLEPRAIPLHRYRAIRRLNAVMLSAQARGALREVMTPDTDIVFASSNPVAADLVGRCGETAAIYFCMDEYAEMKDSDRRIIRACEPLMLDAVDCTFATSRYLCERKTSDRYVTRYLPQGVDYEHFQYRGPCPGPMARVPHPIIGFQGIIGNRVDIDLLERIATAFPDASLVTLGRCEVDIGRLRRHANFHHFDAVPYAELPAWASQFDIGLVAYVRDAHAPAVNPLKLLEYLAMGQQIVSIDLPELDRFRDRVHIARDADEYIARLGMLLRDYPFTDVQRDRQRNAARGESWRARADELVAVCERIVATKRGAPMQNKGAAYAD